MDARRVADVERWESRPFDGGYDGLHDLANGEFSGAVVSGSSYLFMVRGRVVGVFEYTEPSAGEATVEPAPIDRFEDTDGTAHEAPHETLALLLAMVASGGETRGRYYSQKTPIEEVDRTLQDGGFTGYVELSENVLSGDYYLVYHGGRRRSVAYVGQSRRLKTDDEAFDLAVDEVGIYEVNAVRLSTAEIPGSPSGGAAVPNTGSAPVDGGDGADGSAAADESASVDPGAPGDPSDVEDSERDPSGDIQGTTGAPGNPSSSGPEFDLDAAMMPGGADDQTPADEGDDDGAGRPESVDEDELAEAIGGGGDDPDEAEASESREAETSDGTPGGTEETAVESAVSAVPDDDSDPDDEPPDPHSSEPAGATDDPTTEDVSAAVVTESEADGPETGDAPGAGTPESGTVPGFGDGENPRVVPSVDPELTARAEGPPATERATPDRAMVDGETVAGLRSELSERQSRIEELRERLEAVEAERDELAERVDRLEERLAESGAAPLENTREISPAEALSGTSVLIRYRSKSEPTLVETHDGEADRETLAGNLVLEPHPTFDTEGIAVSGLTFEAFIRETQAYRFVQWLVAEFPFEIRETGSVVPLEPLYDALPTLDRVEFDATVTLEGADRETARFDLVGRDRRGDPLLVAHLEDDHVPTNGPTMEEFVTEATAAAESHDALVAAFAVTASYFEPAALTVAGEATGGSLLSRSKRKSFVKTSRKGGYHLCLVEDREESFYLTVPEL